MRYTNEQRERIKNTFKPRDRAKLRNKYGNVARQYWNGLKPSVSAARAAEIADVCSKPRLKIIRMLRPDLF